VTVPALRKVAQCRDKDDQMFIELAIAGKAALLVTGDDDLLSMAGDVAFDLVTPAQLRDQLVEERSG
jgi:predicted nucleic acid-binding protein